LLDECHDALELSEKERIKVKQEGMAKWARAATDLEKQREQYNVLVQKYENMETKYTSTLNEFKVKATN